MVFAASKIESSDNWRTLFYNFLDTRLDKIEKECSMEDLGEISKAVFQERAEILGRLTLGLIERRFGYHSFEGGVKHCADAVSSQSFTK